MALSKALAFAVRVRTKRHDRADDLEKNEADGAAVDDGGQHGDALNRDLSCVAEEEAVRNAVEGFLGEHTGE